MNDKSLVDNGAIVASLGSAVSHGSSNISCIPPLLVRIVDENRWQHFVSKLGREVFYDSFEDFAATPPTAGLGIGVDVLRRLVRDDPAALDALDRAVQKRHGGDRKSDKAKIKHDNVKLDQPNGNSESAALRRLRKDRPDLHTRVLANELTAHAAAVQAGFRPKTVTIRLDRPESIAATLKKHLDATQRQQLLNLLKEN